MFFQKKNPPETIIRTFNHTIGFKPEEFSADEKDIIANSAQAVLKILKNKLMVVAMYSLGNKTEHDVFKTLGKTEALEELIGYFTHYEAELKRETEILPFRGNNF